VDVHEDKIKQKAMKAVSGISGIQFNFNFNFKFSSSSSL